MTVVELHRFIIAFILASVRMGAAMAVLPEAVVAWTGKRPNGFCPRLRLRDIFIPRKARLRLRFFGPCIVWTEGS